MASALAKLRSAHSSLTPVLERIASYALSNPQKVIYHTVTELAEASGASEASVIRFCHDLGYSGFQDFKLALAVDLASQPATPSEDGPIDSSAEVVRRVVTEAQRAVSDTGELIDAQDIETAARKLLTARRIEVFGVGASGIVAEYFLYKLIRLGLTATAYRDPHLASMSAATLGTGDVAIGISSSGSIVDTVEALRLGRKAGAFTIAITNRPRSPLTSHAELVLVAANPESPLTGGAVLSKVSQLLLLEALFNVMLRLEPDRSHTLRQTAEAVVQKSF